MPVREEPTAPTLRQIDEEFLLDLARSDERSVTEIRHEHGRPRVEIEVISDPHIDVPDDARPAADGALAYELAESFTDRWDMLREPFGEDTPNLRVLRGSASVELGPHAPDLGERAGSQVWEAAFERLADRGQGVRPVSAGGGAATGGGAGRVGV